MAASHSGTTNGVNGHHGLTPIHRFSDVPASVYITVTEGGEPLDVDIPLDQDIQDDPTELCTLLENENSGRHMWTVMAMGYAKNGMIDVAIEVLNRAFGSFNEREKLADRLGLLTALFWAWMYKVRSAPRIVPEIEANGDHRMHDGTEVHTKDYCLQQATVTINEMQRIGGPQSLVLARGALQLIRAYNPAPTRGATVGPVGPPKQDAMKQANSMFDDCLRLTHKRNILALLGKARIAYASGKFSEALEMYQKILQGAPQFVDPDPRIGIGCCLWELGHKEDAKHAWARALELNPESKIGNILMGIYYLYSSAQYQSTDPQFAALYKKAISQYAQKAFKLDEKYPLSCTTFASFFLLKNAPEQVERLANRAIEYTDVPAVTSDAYYLLARKEHAANNLSKANSYYTRADQARGGDEKGSLPAKFGSAQMRVLMNDYEGAKFQLEKIVQQNKNIEALTLLGSLYAEDLFAAQKANSKEDKSTELKKAISMLETVRNSWKDPKKRVSPDPAVLLNLARLHEIDGHFEKSIQCLEQVEQLEIDAIPQELRPDESDTEAETRRALRKFVPPQLLNNMGCIYYQSDKLDKARDLFEASLSACTIVADQEQDADTDALVTTISFNLARTYEAEGLLDEAKKVYEGLLERHDDYIDAKSRLAYIALRQDPHNEGPKAIQDLYKSESSNLEVRALFGYYLRRSKRKGISLNDDPEFRHYKHTLQQFDKHDMYSLVGMGNVQLAVAREMRRDTEQERVARRKMYEKAVEFFDKALQLDPQNAYAAQGVAIALIEDKKDLAAAVQILTKVKETMKDASVYINLGHVYVELKQYSRAIENYETALAKDRSRDPLLLSFLGRVWLIKSRIDKDVQGMRMSLDYALRVSFFHDPTFRNRILDADMMCRHWR
jgi:RNA polymerase-associated protein CTR9